jgi:thioredoxin 1
MFKHSIEVNDNNFHELVIRSEKPVLVDFWASWCDPCKLIAPMIEELAKNRDDIVVAKVNVDKSIKTSAKLGIRGLPVLMIFSGGHLQGTRIGAIPQSQLESFVRQVVR